MQYSIDDLVKVAKRDNNAMRPYLYVNPLQGKHIPAKPEDVLGMCQKLANIVNVTYPKDSLYIIGFAETATGVAAAITSYLQNAVYYQNTTREYLKNEEFLYFTESHSHAADQMLRLAGIEKCIRKIDRIIFIDDEVTTGNTICKLIDIIEKKYGAKRLNFSIISILNSMTRERTLALKERGIECLFLHGIPYEYHKECIIDITFDDNRHAIAKSAVRQDLKEIDFPSATDPRGIVKFADYEEEIMRFADNIVCSLAANHYISLLVLGTEEFMYPAFRVGEMIKSKGIADNVWIHSTTRSPIIASGDAGYPLYYRYQIRSLYDADRTTFIYNLKQYDKVIILTDSLKDTGGLSDLWYALKSVGNQDITVAKWTHKR